MRPIPAIRLALASAVGLALGGPALAQRGVHEVNDDAMLPGFDISADVAADLDVHDSTGRKIGEVEEVLGPERDTPRALVVEFENDFLPGEDDERIVPLSAFTFDGRAMVLAEGTDVSVMPKWND